MDQNLPTHNRNTKGDEIADDERRASEEEIVGIQKEMKSPTSERGARSKIPNGILRRAKSERGGSKNTEYFHVTFGQPYFRQKYLVDYIFVINILWSERPGDGSEVGGEN